MILPTGTNQSNPHSSLISIFGFTFIEVMVTLAILSLGIVMIFKGFFYSLNQMNYLTHRLYASNLLEDRLAQVQKTLKLYNVIPMDQAEKIPIDVGPSSVDFTQQTSITSVEHFSSIFKVDLSLSWKDNNHVITLSRSSYMVNPGDSKKN